MFVAVIDEVGRYTDGLHARLDNRCCVEASTDGVTTFSTTRIVLAEARTENTEISLASPGGCHSVFF